MAVFKGEKLSNDITNNGTMNDAYDLSPRYLSDATTDLYKRSCPSVGPSILRGFQTSFPMFR